MTLKARVFLYSTLEKNQGFCKKMQTRIIIKRMGMPIQQTQRWQLNHKRRNLGRENNNNDIKYTRH